MPTLPHLSQHQSRWDNAVETVHHRRLYDSLIKRQMMDAAERYNNSIVYPLPDVENEPTFPPIAAQIIADAIDGYATRANDTVPAITAPAVNPTLESHRKKADLRAQAWAATWYESQLPLRLGRAYRQLYGYGTYCLAIEANHTTKRAKIVTRDPLLTYPEPMGNDEVRTPEDIGYVYGRSPQWIRSRYPDAASFVDRYTTAEDDLWDLLDWTDKDWHMIGLLGRRSTQSYMRRFGSDIGTHHADQPMDQSLLLAAYPNRRDLVPAVCPTQVTLDRLVSSISRIVPITDVLNQLAALNFISVEKGVFPHIFVLGEQGGTPTIVGGQFKDGRTGQANLLENVRGIDTLNLQPSPASQVLSSDLERAARLSSGTPSMTQGELTGSIRSGQTVNQLQAVSIDPRLKEAHAIMSYALDAIDEAVAATYEGFWPGRTYTVFSGWQGANRHVTYTPNKVWGDAVTAGGGRSRHSSVAYPLPGLDAQGTNIILGQLNQARLIGRRTARAIHPLITNPDGQEQELIEEALDDAISMTAIDLVKSGQLAWTDLAAIRAKVRTGQPMEDAIAEAQEEAQERQATQPEAPAEPELALSPESMPGLNAPEAGGQALAPPAAPPPSDSAQFDQIMDALMASPNGAG